MTPPQADRFRVLFVCTGNVCRSPTAEMLLRRRVEEAAATQAIDVASAGVGTETGWRMDPTITELLGLRGLTGMTEFRSRALDSAILSGADLVLTGTRDHRLRIGRDWPDFYVRTFTIREAARMLAGMPEQVRAALPAGVSQRAAHVVAWLQHERGLVSIPAEVLDVADPIGRRPAVYRRMVDEVSAAVDVVAGALLPGGQ